MIRRQTRGSRWWDDHMREILHGASTAFVLKGLGVLVTGAGGFISHHLTSFLKEQGYWVRGADLKNPEFEASKASGGDRRSYMRPVCS